MKDFKNKSGEGIIASICNLENNHNYNVLCGNTKLMTNLDIASKYVDVYNNINFLEQDG